MKHNSTISEQIEEIDQQIKKLRIERARLKRLRPPRERFPKNPDVDLVVWIVEMVPGVTRKQIWAFFPNMTQDKMTHLLTMARRNRGLIENRGTKSHPHWFLVENV